MKIVSLTTVRALRAALSRSAAKLGNRTSSVTAPVIGRLQWQPHTWLAWIGGRLAQGWHYLAADARRIAV